MMEHEKAVLFAVSVLLVSCTTVLTQSNSTFCPIAGSLGDVDLKVTRCDNESFSATWEMNNYCKEMDSCWVKPIFTCDTVVPHRSQFNSPSNVTFNWPEEINECRLSGCYTNVSAQDEYFAIIPEVSVTREENLTCNIVTLLSSNMLAPTLISIAVPVPPTNMLTSTITSPIVLVPPTNMPTPTLMSVSEPPTSPSLSSGNIMTITLACTLIAGLATLVLIFAVVLFKCKLKRCISYLDIYKYYGDVKPFRGVIDEHFNPVKIRKEASVESVATILEKCTNTKDQQEEDMNSGKGPGTTMDISLWHDHKSKHAKSYECLSKKTDFVRCMSLPAVNTYDSSVHKSENDSGHPSTHTTFGPHGVYAPTTHLTIGAPYLKYDVTQPALRYIGQQTLDLITESDLVSETNFYLDQDSFGNDFDPNEVSITFS